jgi:pyruvate/2-oxoglutarate/acetoin dehydrogenase E1 component
VKQVESIRRALGEILESHPEALILGEDIEDPYGGAFKVTQSLSTRFAPQVVQTPISEQGFVGLAAGLAYTGFLPVVEIMFGDFLPLIADSIINSASKLDWLGRGKMKGRLLIRTPVGGRRGYGPIHSQNLERLFFGWPGVHVYSTNRLGDAGNLVHRAFEDAEPVKFLIESKTDYSKPVLTDEELSSAGFKREVAPTGWQRCTQAREREDPDLVMVVYGAPLNEALVAAKTLFIEEELMSTILVPERISPIDVRQLSPLIERSRKLCVIEDGHIPAGWCSHLLSALASHRASIMLNDVIPIGSEFTPIPADPVRELNHLPSAERIASAVLKAL